VTAALLVAYGWKSSVVLPFAGLSAVGMAIAIMLPGGTALRTDA
jgi:hypothetical protein